MIEVINHCQWTRLDAAQPCALPGNLISHAVVVSGDAEIVHSEQVLSTLSPGDVFISNGANADYMLRARNGCVVLMLTEARIDRLSEQARARFKCAMLHALTKRLSLSAVNATGNSSDRAH